MACAHLNVQTEDPSLRTCQNASSYGNLLRPYFLRGLGKTAVNGTMVSAPDRVERRKMTFQEGLFRDLDNFRFPPVPRSDCLKLDTEARSADLNAQEIVRRFGLGATRNS